MNIIDILIVLFFISALVRGVELGAIRQLCSTAGLFAGFFLGFFVQSKLIHFADDASSKALLTLVVILTCVGVLASIGEYLGVRLKNLLHERPGRVITKLDYGLGSVLAGATLVAAIWLAGSIFANAPFPGVQKQVKNSVIIMQLNKTLPSAPAVVTRLSHLIDPNTFPNVFTGLEPKIDTNRPLPSIGELDAGVQKARVSTVKVQGESCSTGSSGSGFVVDKDLIVTNAHVVAGVAKPFVIDAAGRHPAQVVLFDPQLDIAVLRAGGLAGPPLRLLEGIVANNTSAAILGYPGGGDFVAGPAVVMESFKAIGQDIYNRGKTTREVYSVKGTIRPGNSGGPLINKEGDVIGVVFAQSTTYDEVGYALIADSVGAKIGEAKTRINSVSTGDCTQ